MQKLKILTNNTILPTKAYKNDGAYDIYIPQSFTIKQGETKTICLNICIGLPKKCHGIIIPRSSIAKKGLIVHNALIDNSYRGPIHLIISNISKKTYTFETNARVCSLVIIKLPNLKIKKVNKLKTTQRNNNRFGSSGK